MKEVVIQPGRMLKGLIVMATFLVLLHLLSYVPMLLGMRDEPIHAFNMDDERNLAAFFSTILLWLCGLLTWFIAQANTDRVQARKWIGWALIFIYLGLDEMLSFHERIAWPVHHLLPGLNLYGFAWLVPYSIIAVLLVFIYAKFWWELPGMTKVRIAMGVSLFVIGGMGCELSGWVLTRMHAPEGFWHLEILVEEVLEMAGSITLVSAFLYHIQEYHPVWNLRVAEENSSRTNDES